MSEAPAPTDTVIVHTRDITIKVHGGSWQTALTFARLLQYQFDVKAKELRAMYEAAMYGDWNPDLPI